MQKTFYVIRRPNGKLVGSGGRGNARSVATAYRLVDLAAAQRAIGPSGSCYIYMSPAEHEQRDRFSIEKVRETVTYVTLALDED